MVGVFIVGSLSVILAVLVKKVDGLRHGVRHDSYNKLYRGIYCQSHAAVSLMLTELVNGGEMTPPKF